LVKDILLSPLLRKALHKPIPHWFLSGSTIVARLNRKEIGDDDAGIIANILISQFEGPVVIEDFGFYGRRQHAALIREDCRRLHSLRTRRRTSRRAMLMEKVGRGCTFEDAETLAKYAGHRPDPSRKDNDFNKFDAEATA
jgi:hypothetical protein